MTRIFGASWNLPLLYSALAWSLIDPCSIASISLSSRRYRQSSALARKPYLEAARLATKILSGALSITGLLLVDYGHRCHTKPCMQRSQNMVLTLWRQVTIIPPHVRSAKPSSRRCLNWRSQSRLPLRMLHSSIGISSCGVGNWLSSRFYEKFQSSHRHLPKGYSHFAETYAGVCVMTLMSTRPRMILLSL